MNSKSGNVMKYVGAAMAVGGMVMAGSGLMNSNSSLKKRQKKLPTKLLILLAASLTAYRT